MEILLRNGANINQKTVRKNLLEKQILLRKRQHSYLSLPPLPFSPSARGEGAERQAERDKESVRESVGIGGYLMCRTNIFLLHIPFVIQSISSSQNDVCIFLSFSFSFFLSPSLFLLFPFCKEIFFRHPFQWMFDVSLGRVVGKDGLEREWA